MTAHFDIPRIRNMLASSYQLTGFRIGIYDIRFEKIIEYPTEHCAFCTLVRKKAQSLCHQSDARHGMAAGAQDQLYTYRCPAGLTESIAPIRFGQMVFGYLMIGQLRTEEDLPAQVLAQLTGKYGLDAAALQRAYCQLPITTSERVAAAAHILQICAAHLWLEKMVMQERSQLPVRLQDYLYVNYARPLTMDVICRELNVGKTTIAAAARTHLNASVGELLARQRMDAACQLLLQTDLSIARIAEAVGIPDGNYFAKVFRKYMGCSPRAYRRSAGRGA